MWNEWGSQEEIRGRRALWWLLRDTGCECHAGQGARLSLPVTVILSVSQSLTSNLGSQYSRFCCMCESMVCGGGMVCGGVWCVCGVCGVGGTGGGRYVCLLCVCGIRVWCIYVCVSVFPQGFQSRDEDPPT